jgi:hypothetical protein
MREGVVAGWPAIVLLCSCSACGPSGVSSLSASREETTVKGVVRIRGKAVDNGKVIFNAANVSRPDAELRQASINKDGTYTLKTLVGVNQVQVSCKELHTAQNRMFAETEYAFTADSGENTFDIEIPPPALARPIRSTRRGAERLR